MRIWAQASALVLSAALGVQANSKRILEPGRFSSDVRYVRSSDQGLRVAIVGAGAAGSSAAFWLSKAESRLNKNITTTIYEKDDYIGGRSTTIYPYGDKNLMPIELGASVFVDANKNIVRAVKEYNLSAVGNGYPGGDSGIWDGRRFVLTWGGEGREIFERYGYDSPAEASSLTLDMINTYLNLYKPHPPRPSIANISSSLNFTALTSVSASNYLAANNVSSEYIHQVVEGATRVNYGQNVDDIHALKGLISMAVTGAQSVAGGNWQVFAKWVQESGAKLKPKTTVQTLQKSDDGKWHVGAEGGGEEAYDAVVLAAPYKGSNIAINAPGLDLEKSFPPVDYVHLHVTLLSTTSERPQPHYFSNASASGVQVPQRILTMSTGSVEPEFNSLTYLENIQRDGQPKYLVKLFSKTRIDDDWLAKVFGPNTVEWVYRKEWDAYPISPPTTTYPSVSPAPGLYYVNAFEPFISTMETETIASLNVVDLLLHDRYKSGICGQKEEGLNQNLSEDFIWGWDCP